jgi:uncharacterized metal-binding protein
MTQECCTENKDIMILACSGASNLGQLANQAAVELTREGFGRMSCVAALGAQLSNFVKSAKNAPRLIAIDGCPLSCARKIVEKADIPLHCHVVLYDLGIEKTMNTILDPAEVEKVKSAVKGECYGEVTLVGVDAGPSRGCCG